MVQGEEYHLASTFLKKNYLKLILEKTVFRAKLFEDPLMTNLGLNSPFLGSQFWNLRTKLFKVTIQMKLLWQNFCMVYYLSL